MVKKYYAVKEGRNIGIFTTWDECKASVDGYSGAIYKSFKTLDEAKEFIGIVISKSNKDDNIVSNKEDKTTFNKDSITAYVDGSFNVETKEFSYGAVIFYKGEEFHLNEKFDDEDLASMRNVAGEIFGSMAAMKFALEKGAKSLKIYHDYEGISKWCLGLWKTNKEGTIAYKKYYDEVSTKINIEFVKVKGHSGDKYNDLADKLAKEALGIE